MDNILRKKIEKEVFKKHNSICWTPSIEQMVEGGYKVGLNKHKEKDFYINTRRKQQQLIHWVNDCCEPFAQKSELMNRLNDLLI